MFALEKQLGKDFGTHEDFIASKRKGFVSAQEEKWFLEKGGVVE